MKALLFLVGIACVVYLIVNAATPSTVQQDRASATTSHPFKNSITAAQYDSYRPRYGMDIGILQAELGPPSGRTESASGCTYQGCEEINEWLYYNDVNDTYETDSYCFAFTNDKLVEDFQCD